MPEKFTQAQFCFTATVRDKTAHIIEEKSTVSKEFLC